MIWQPSPESIEDIGNQLLPTIAYGDAVGLPYEGGKPLESDSVHGLAPITHNPFIDRYPSGTWSDDTHLSIATAKSLIEEGKFGLDHQAEWHVMALDHAEGAGYDDDLVPPVTTKGDKAAWGKGTFRAVNRLRNGADPRESGEPNGAGNGVLMKIAPLVFWQIARNEGVGTIERQVAEFTHMTHATPEAAVASIVHAMHLRDLWRYEGDALEQLQASRDRADVYEKRYGAQPVLSGMLGKLATANRSITSQTILDVAPRGFYVPETLAMVYGSFCIERTYPESVYRAVELGGDADSTGSIIATMSLFDAKGDIEIPVDYKTIHGVERLEKISEDLTRSATI